MSDLLRPSPPATFRERVDTVVQLVRSAPRVSAAVFAAVVVVAAVGFVVFHRPPPAPAIQLPRAESPAATATTIGEVVVDVAGAVGRPGVVRLGGPGRVIDAIAAAGGAAPDADLNQVNLAAKVGDGDRVYVPRHGESPPLASAASGTATAQTGPVDLNRATVEQLDALPGVGPATAKAIVDYRTRHGSFRAVDDLLSVQGIGPAKLTNLKPLVRV